MVIGWAMENHLRTELVLAAINMAFAQRRPEGVIHHSDRGCQYTSLAFGKRCRELGIVPSVGSVGDAYDNAMAESFFASVECELLDRCSFRSQTEAKLTVFEYLEGFYNTRRRHSSLGYRSPLQFERDLRSGLLVPSLLPRNAPDCAAVKARDDGKRETYPPYTVSLREVLPVH